MNVVVFGEDIYTSTVIESLIESGHKVLLIVTPEYYNENYIILKETASKYHIGFIKSENVNSVEVQGYLENVKPELIVAVHLRKILHEEIFSQAARGAINVHPSLLPRYRGLSPQHQAILHGDDESGVTVHFIDADVDTGEIIVQKKFPVSEDDYIVDVQVKMLAIYKKIVVEALGLLEDKAFKPMEQELAGSSYFAPLKRNDRKIDLSKSRLEIYRLVRAVSVPYKGAFYNNYIIWAARIPEPAVEEELKNMYTEAGLYVDKEGGKIIIRLSDGILVSDDYETK